MQMISPQFSSLYRFVFKQEVEPNKNPQAASLTWAQASNNRMPISETLVRLANPNHPGLPHNAVTQLQTDIFQPLVDQFKKDSKESSNTFEKMELLPTKATILATGKNVSELKKAFNKKINIQYYRFIKDSARLFAEKERLSPLSLKMQANTVYPHTQLSMANILKQQAESYVVKNHKKIKTVTVTSTEAGYKLSVSA